MLKYTHTQAGQIIADSDQSEIPEDEHNRKYREKKPTRKNINRGHRRAFDTVHSTESALAYTM